MKTKPSQQVCLHVALPASFLKSWRAHAKRNGRTMGAQARLAMQKDLDAAKAGAEA